MTNGIRVARTLQHGREAAMLAEDCPHIQKIKEAVDLLQFVVEGARPLIKSERGRAMVTDLEDVLVNLRHDACVNSTAELALEAAQLVGVRMVRVS